MNEKLSRNIRKTEHTEMHGRVKNISNITTSLFPNEITFIAIGSQIVNSTCNDNNYLNTAQLFATQFLFYITLQLTTTLYSHLL